MNGRNPTLFWCWGLRTCLPSLKRTHDDLSRYMHGNFFHSAATPYEAIAQNRVGRWCGLIALFLNFAALGWVSFTTT